MQNHKCCQCVQAHKMDRTLYQYMDSKFDEGSRAQMHTEIGYKFALAHTVQAMLRPGTVVLEAHDTLLSAEIERVAGAVRWMKGIARGEKNIDAPEATFEVSKSCAGENERWLGDID